MLKNISNLGKTLNKKEQKLTFGGINPGDSRIPIPTDGGGGSGGGSGDPDCTSRCYNAFGACVREDKGSCISKGFWYS